MRAPHLEVPLRQRRDAASCRGVAMRKTQIPMYKQSAYILVLAVAALVTIGLVMLYSTGAFAPDSHGDQFNFLKRQSFWLAVGFLFSIVFALVDYHWLQRSWYIIYRCRSRVVSSLLCASGRDAGQWFLALDTCGTNNISGIRVGEARFDYFYCVVVLEI